jgi:hypothetical protein
VKTRAYRTNGAAPQEAYFSPLLPQRPRSTFLGATLACLVLTCSTAVHALESSSTPNAESTTSRTSPTGSVFVDPLGFLLFGPTFGAEIGFGQISAIAYGRWLSPGVLAHSLFLNDNFKFAFSYGAGLKGRYYFRQGLAGPHVGIAAELIESHTRDEDVGRVAFNTTIFVPELEAGYRLGFGRFYLGASAGVGYAFQIAQNVENINGGNQAANYRADDISTIYGSASLDLGLFF